MCVGVAVDDITICSVAGSAGQVITGNHNTYVISAESADSADGWVAAIRRVMFEVCLQ